MSGASPDPQRVARARGGVVASQRYEASEAGAAILAAGGNAFDAAAATALALCVCEPAACGIGGQSTALLHFAATRRTVALDGSSRAPNRVPPSEVPRAERIHGHRATTVPSTPAVIGWLVEAYGTLPFADIAAPAIELAERGFVVSPLQHRLTLRELEHLRAGSAGRFLLKDGGEPYAPGEMLTQPVLARTLGVLAREGYEAFYQGPIADAIHADMEAHGGYLHRDDLAWIPRPIERRPVAGRFRSHRVLTFPPPGAGRTLLQILRLWEELPERWQDFESVQGLVAFAETVRRAGLDRRDRPFDPSFYPQVEDKRLLDGDYTRLVAKQIRGRARLRGETTHLSVVDADGNLVALTQSIERVYGSCEAAPDLGFVYNDYLSAFEQEDISHPHFLRPNAVPWASVAPTIVFRGRRPWLALGSPGSERIATALAQVIARLTAGESPLAAVTAPRLHCDHRGVVSIEAARLRSDLPAALTRRGFEVKRVESFSFRLGCVQIAGVDREGPFGVADPRRDGSAHGVVRAGVAPDPEEDAGDDD